MVILSNSCAYCQSTKLFETLEPNGSVHYGRVTCGDCGRFLKWLPKPKIPEVSVVRLLHSTTLEVWERKFLKAVACRSPSKAELIVIEAIEAKVNPATVGRGSG